MNWVVCFWLVFLAHCIHSFNKYWVLSHIILLVNIIRLLRGIGLWLALCAFWGLGFNKLPLCQPFLSKAELIAGQTEHRPDCAPSFLSLLGRHSTIQMTEASFKFGSFFCVCVFITLAVLKHRGNYVKECSPWMVECVLLIFLHNQTWTSWANNARRYLFFSLHLIRDSQFPSAPGEDISFLVTVICFLHSMVIYFLFTSK